MPHAAAAAVIVAAYAFYLWLVAAVVVVVAATGRGDLRALKSEPYPRLTVDEVRKIIKQLAGNQPAGCCGRPTFCFLRLAYALLAWVCFPLGVPRIT